MKIKEKTEHYFCQNSMPQKKSYQHITKYHIRIMNTLNDEIFIKKDSMEETEFPTHAYKNKIINHDNKNELSKKIFCICDTCKGPLVPIANCMCCKKASMRRCVICDGIREIQHHEPCKILVSFANTILQKSTEINI